MSVESTTDLYEALLKAHANQPVLRAGVPADLATAAMIMLHGRGASAADILGLSADLERAGLAFLAPQAPEGRWYPNPFLAPLASNQPWLDAALARLRQLVENLVKGGLSKERIFLLGFSQGGSLALEFAARSGQRWGGVFGLSGSVIGPPASPRSYPSGLSGTPVLLGCSDADPYIPQASVEESSRVLSSLGAQVDLRLYPNLGHSINVDEVKTIRAVLQKALGS